MSDAAVHDGRSHPDESTVFQVATMDQAGLPNGHIVTDDDIEFAGVDVNHRPVLDVASRTNLDRIVIATQHAVEPDTELWRNGHRTPDSGGRRNPCTNGNLGLAGTEVVD